MEISGTLCKAERFKNAGDIAASIEEYKKVCTRYMDANDYPTASYFYAKCLVMSKEQKFAEGEALAEMGLGQCEEGEKNVARAQEYYEGAIEKALDKSLHAIAKTISEQLIRVYEKLAANFEEDGDYAKTLDYYEKCLDASKRALNTKKEAECYYRLGATYEKNKELEKSVEALEKFLAICERTNDLVMLSMRQSGRTGRVWR